MKGVQVQDAAPRAGPPLIWVLLGEKPGDNAQAIIAAEALSLPFHRKKLAVLEPYLINPPPVRPSMHHIDRARSDILEQPWPDLVITIGRRLSMAALWIKAQSESRTKIVLLGAPKGCQQCFDLVIVPSFYEPTRARRELRIKLPLISLDSRLLSIAEKRYQDSLGRLPKPLTVLLFGGPVGPMMLDPPAAIEIVRKAIAISPREGSLAICTSRRTPPEVARALEQALPPGASLHLWAEAENPYLGLIAHGDRFVVSGDSASMLVEIARLGKPLAIAELKSRWPRLAENLRRRLLPMPRDLERLHSELYKEGWAIRLGDPFAHPTLSPGSEVDAVRLEVLKLI
jgi:mitochondrial fission protein ELM1